MNKKAEEKLISIYWFFILTLVAGGILLMVNSFYNDPYDVREIEVNLLSEKIADCISYAGVVNPNMISDTGIFREEFVDTFLEKCALNFEKENQWEETQYYFEVHFYEAGNLKKEFFDFSKGNSNWKADCDLDTKKYKKLVVCKKSQFYTFGNSDKFYLVDILSIVRKTEQNV